MLCSVRKIDFFSLILCLELYFKSIINNFILSIMSKTTEIQIEKSRNLIEGLRRHVREMGERGVSNNEIDQMEKTVTMLSEANAEVDRLREELTPKVKKMGTLGTGQRFTPKKRTVPVS